MKNAISLTGQKVFWQCLTIRFHLRKLPFWSQHFWKHGTPVFRSNTPAPLGSECLWTEESMMLSRWFISRKNCWRHVTLFLLCDRQVFWSCRYPFCSQSFSSYSCNTFTGERGFVHAAEPALIWVFFDLCLHYSRIPPHTNDKVFWT